MSRHNKLLQVICQLLINFYRRYFVPPPEIEVIAHYAYCPNCRRTIERQGWSVGFKHENEEIYEVTFKAVENVCPHVSGECVEDEEDEEDEEEEEEEAGGLRVQKPKRLIVGEERPTRPKANFYV